MYSYYYYYYYSYYKVLLSSHGLQHVAFCSVCMFELVSGGMIAIILCYDRGNRQYP